MAIRTEVVDDGRGALLVASDNVDGRELLEAHAQMLASPAIAERIRYRLSDYSAVTATQVTADDVTALAEFHERMQETVPDCVVAIVADKNVVFGLARMWQTRLDVREVGWEVRVFRDRAEAVQWLRARVLERYGFEPSVR